MKITLLQSLHNYSHCMSIVNMMMPRLYVHKITG